MRSELYKDGNNTSVRPLLATGGAMHGQTSMCCKSLRRTRDDMHVSHHNIKLRNSASKYRSSLFSLGLCEGRTTEQPPATTQAD